jgi:hypothetical protein
MCRCAERREIIARAATNIAAGNLSAIIPAIRQARESIALDARDIRSAAAQRLAAARSRLTRR